MACSALLCSAWRFSVHFAPERAGPRRFTRRASLYAVQEFSNRTSLRKLPKWKHIFTDGHLMGIIRFISFSRRCYWHKQQQNVNISKVHIVENFSGNTKRKIDRKNLSFLWFYEHNSTFGSLLVLKLYSILSGHFVCNPLMWILWNTNVDDTWNCLTSVDDTLCLKSATHDKVRLENGRLHLHHSLFSTAKTRLSRARPRKHKEFATYFPIKIVSRASRDAQAKQADTTAATRQQFE